MHNSPEKYRIENRPALLAAALLLIATSLAGCSGSASAPHGGLVPSISGEKSLHAGETASYDFDASSAHGYRLAYAVNWGDGTKPMLQSDAGSSVSGDHAWAHPGTYTITATVTDGHGESGISTYSVEVTSPPPPDSN